MQDYGRGGLHGAPYDNRIYSRKYELDVGEMGRPDLGGPSTTSNHQYVQRQGFTQGRSVQKNWQDYRHSNLSENYARPPTSAVGATGGQPSYVTTFKPSREDDLLKKLDMYQQKYQLGGQPKTPQANTQVRKIFDAIQLPGGRAPINELPNKRSYAYSNNNSPQKEAQIQRGRADPGVQRPWKQSNDYEVGGAQRFQARRNDPIRILDGQNRDERETQDMHRPVCQDLRSSYEGAAKFSYNAQPTEQREHRRPNRERISYETNMATEQRPTTYQGRGNFQEPPEHQRREIRGSEPYPEQRASFERPAVSTNYEPTSKNRSISHSMKADVRASFDSRQTNDYRGHPSRGVYDYRQGTHQRHAVQTRGHYPGQPRRPQEENTFTEEEQLKTSENEPKEARRFNNNSSQPRIPMASKELLENRQQNRTDSSQWEDQAERPRLNRDPDEREDRLRDIRRKVSVVGNTNDEPSFHLERSEKKQSLRERSQQLRQKMNEPSPLKEKLAVNNGRTDRTSKENKENIENQPSRNRSVKIPEDDCQPQERKRPQPSSVDFTERQQTPSKQLPEKKLQFEEQTYRKIETINDLNNKINERIRHILSSFNQETC